MPLFWNAERPADFLPAHRSTTRQNALAFVGLIIILSIFRARLFPYLSERYLGGFEYDAGLYLWLIKSVPKNLFSLPWFSTTAFYPYGQSLAWSDNFIFPALIASLFKFLDIHLVYNLLILGANLLTGFLTYRLAITLSGLAFPSFVAGAVYMCYSFLTLHLGHPQLQFTFFLPLSLLFLFEYLKAPKLRHAIALGMTITLCFLTTVYYALFIPLMCACVLGGIALLRSKHFSVQHYVTLALGVLLGVLPVLPFVLPYISVRSVFGSRYLHEANAFSATPLSYLSSSPLGLLYPFTASWSHAEAQLFPGIIVLLGMIVAYYRMAGTKHLKRANILFLSFFTLALLSYLLPPSLGLRSLVIAILLWGTLLGFGYLVHKLGKLERRLGSKVITNRGIIATILLSALFFFILSFGPLGDSVWKDKAFAPLTLIRSICPGIDSIRAVGRFGIVSILFLTLLLPFAITELQKRIPNNFRAACCSAILIFSLLENYNTVYPIEGDVQAPAIFETFRSQPFLNRVVAVLPFTSTLLPDGGVEKWSNFAKLNVNYMQWSEARNLTVINGYSGLRSKLMLEYPKKLSAFPDRRSLQALAGIVNLEYVIFLAEFDPRFTDPNYRGQFDTAVKNASDSLTLIASVEGNYLFKIHPEIPLTADFNLLVPPTPPGVLLLELKSLYKKDTPKVPLEIRLGEAVINKLEIPADGIWHSQSMTLPPGSDSVAPRKLSFKSADNSFYLRQRIFTER